jgi:DNA-binding transcriptional MerR regulator
MADRSMRIGQFADEAGVSVDAVRFYERRGVLHPAPRTPSGYRTFDRHDLDRVLLARQLQRLGLTLEEVVDALAAHDVDDATCESERWRLEQVESRIEAQMASLRRTRRQIRGVLAACEAGHCPLTSEVSV